MFVSWHVVMFSILNFRVGDKICVLSNKSNCVSCLWILMVYTRNYIFFFCMWNSLISLIYISVISVSHLWITLFSCFLVSLDTYLLESEWNREMPGLIGFVQQSMKTPIVRYHYYNNYKFLHFNFWKSHQRLIVYDFNLVHSYSKWIC